MKTNKVTKGEYIPAEYVMDMYHNVCNELIDELNVSFYAFSPLGSTGKQPKGEYCGDIDIAVNVNSICAGLNVDIEDVQEVITKRIQAKYEGVVSNRGFRIISFLYPIPNTKEKGQIDLMLVEQLELAKFIYHSPNYITGESNYKGLYRSILLFSVIANTKCGEVGYYEDGSIKFFTKYGITVQDGLYKEVKTYEGKRGRLTKPTNVKGTRELITKNPTEIVQIIFGDSYSVNDMNSFESIYKIILSDQFADIYDSILDAFKQRLQELKLQLPIGIRWQD